MRELQTAQARQTQKNLCGITLILSKEMCHNYQFIRSIFTLKVSKNDLVLNMPGLQIRGQWRGRGPRVVG